MGILHGSEVPLGATSGPLRQQAVSADLQHQRPEKGGDFILLQSFILFTFIGN